MRGGAGFELLLVADNGRAPRNPKDHRFDPQSVFTRVWRLQCGHCLYRPEQIHEQPVISGNGTTGITTLAT
jgi:hypothetical protein